MEYNLDSVAPPQKLNPLKRFFNFVTSPQYSRTFSILVVLLIAAAIPLTLAQLKQPTKTQQKAAYTATCRDLKPSETVDPGGLSDNLYVWKADCRQGYSCPNNNPPERGGCPKNEDQSGPGGPVNKDDSAWCYGFEDPNNPGNKCLQLKYIGPPGGPLSSACTPWNNASTSPKCTKPGGAACSDWGAEGYCNWSVSAHQACQQTCAAPTPTTPPNQCEGKLYTVSGRVITSSGGGVSNTTVCLDPVGSCADAAKKATTNSSGNYTIANVAPGGNGHNVYLDPGTIPSGATISSPNPQIINGGTCEDVSVSYRITTGAPGGPTLTPTPTTVPPGQPTPTLTPTPQPGGTKITLNLVLAGIGQRTDRGPQARWNPNPTKTKRDVTIYLYEPGADTSNDADGQRARFKPSGTEAIEYDGSGKFVARNFDLGRNFVPGAYQVFVKTSRYLRKRIPGIQTINAGSNTISQQVTLVLGDANNDNSLNIDDYHAYLSCLSKQTADCIAKADFNDDGKVDTVTPVPDFSDHALFTSQFDIIEGD